MDLISVIVTTYNWKEALAACLASLFAQRDRHFEIVVADDGSRPDTAELIRRLASAAPVPLIHCYQEDQGFRAAAIRNRAASQSHGDYLLFVDGDCLVFPHFIERHRRLAQPGFFVPGNRVLISKAFSQRVLQEATPLASASFANFVKYRMQRNINRLLPLVYVPCDCLRRLRPAMWKNAMTCNLGLWKRDFAAVNGFDELFSGWGYEDSDLVIRLIHHGVRRKDGRFAVPVLHLWHPENQRDKQDANYQRLLERLQRKTCMVAEQGLSQYASHTSSHAKT